MSCTNFAIYMKAIAQQGIFRYGYNGFWLVIVIPFGIVHQLA
ncbi:hypothetical protein [Nostoc sp.]